MKSFYDFSLLWLIKAVKRRIFRISRKVRDLLYVHAKNLFLKTQAVILGILSLLLVPYLYHYYSSRLRKLSKDTEVFVLCRHDFGAFIMLMDYARLWKKNRGDICFVILSTPMQESLEMASLILPDTQVIVFNNFFWRCLRTFFSEHWLHNKILVPVCALLRSDRYNSITLYETIILDAEKRSLFDYHEFDDFHLIQSSNALSEDFENAYKFIRKNGGINHRFYSDYINLHNITNDFTPHKNVTDQLAFLKKSLLFEGPYAVLNVKHGNQSNPRFIAAPNRYNAVIDRLIEKGYHVILQGRAEQPRFPARKGLIDYSKSNLCSLKNDFALYAGSDLILINDTGPAFFGTLYNKPTLQLDSVEFFHTTATKKQRLYYKPIWDKKEERLISWQELLRNPIFFNLAHFIFDPDNNFSFMEMEQEECYEAVEEFLDLLDRDSWFNYTPLQEEFRRSLHPLHLDLNYIKGIPCDSYLKRHTLNSSHLTSFFTKA